MKGCRLHALGHPGAQHRFIHHAGVDALEPMVPPSQHFLQEADLRARKREVWVSVRPWPDEPLARHTKALEQPRDRVLVAIGPSTNRVDRTLDRLVVLAHRPKTPIGVPPLMPQPC